MGQYCDTKVLEKNWFHWLLSSTVPDLEIYREFGLLWTKAAGAIVEKTCEGIKISNQTHCIALATPVYLNSYHGNPQSLGTVFTDGKPKRIHLPSEELNLLSDSWLHRLDTPFAQMDMVIPNLRKKGYVRELPTEQSWHAVLRDIDKMCQGIALRFKQTTEEATMDLANEALLQVTNKLAKYKLVYIPGKAPVFNLLTTTIHRCMYSIMNRRKTQRQGLQKFVDDVEAGVVPRYKSRRPAKTH